MRRLRAILLVLWLCASLLPSSAAEEPRITLHRVQAPLAEVLREVARQAGLEPYVGASVTGLVTVHWDGTPLLDVVQDLGARMPGSATRAPVEQGRRG